MENIALTKEKEISLIKYYLTKSKKIALSLFLGIIMGGLLVVYSQNKEMSNSFQFLSESDVLTEGKPIWTEIFLKNLLVCMILCGGVIYGKILPYIVININGLFWGVVCAANIYTASGMKILSLLPHGVFEITTLIFCTSIGVNPIIKDLKNSKIEYLKMFFGIICILMIAAIIESNISYKIALL